MLWLGTLAGGEIVTARPQPSCGGRLIAARFTRPSSALAVGRSLFPVPRVPSACPGQGPFGCHLTLLAHRQEPGFPKSSMSYTFPEHLQQMNNSWNCFYSGLKECAQQHTSWAPIPFRLGDLSTEPIQWVELGTKALNSDTSWKPLENGTVPMLSDIIIPLRGNDSTKVILLMMLVTCCFLAGCSETTQPPHYT